MGRSRTRARRDRRRERRISDLLDYQCVEDEERYLVKYENGQQSWAAFTLHSDGAFFFSIIGLFLAGNMHVQVIFKLDSLFDFSPYFVSLSDHNNGYYPFTIELSKIMIFVFAVGSE